MEDGTSARAATEEGEVAGGAGEGTEAGAGAGVPRAGVEVTTASIVEAVEVEGSGEEAGGLHRTATSGAEAAVAGGVRRAGAGAGDVNSSYMQQPEVCNCVLGEYSSNYYS